MAGKSSTAHPSQPAHEAPASKATNGSQHARGVSGKGSVPLRAAIPCTLFFCLMHGPVTEAGRGVVRGSGPERAEAGMDKGALGGAGQRRAGRGPALGRAGSTLAAAHTFRSSSAAATRLDGELGE